MKNVRTIKGYFAEKGAISGMQHVFFVTTVRGPNSFLFALESKGAFGH